MRNPFKKYNHIKTRYDEMKERDRQWKIEILEDSIIKRFKKIINVYICGCGK